jgi:hypothetical protein
MKRLGFLVMLVFAATSPAFAGKNVAVPSGDLISVAIAQDIGSRISREGDTFAVTTQAAYYVGHALVLPKGSPGYGTITHIKGAGHFFIRGQLAFTVVRLIAPDGTSIPVETNGVTADADEQAEKNGNAIAQALICRVCVIAKKGNDILIKSGTAFHVETVGAANAPAASGNATPEPIDAALVHRAVSGPKAPASP